MVTISKKPGLEGIHAGDSAICQIDEESGGLRYRGYGIQDLAEHTSFEEIAYLLLKGELPSGEELRSWRKEIHGVQELPEIATHYLAMIPKDADLMDVIRTGVSLLGLTDPDANDSSHEANIRKATRLIARIPLLLSEAFRSRHQHPPLQPIPEISFAENLLYLVTGTRDEAGAKDLEVSLNLYAEHEFNASTFAARVTASTLADLYGGVTSAIATLKGPLHGGANEAVANMFQEIGDPLKAKDWVHAALSRKERVMGFGHRVLKHEDPRSRIMKQRAKALSERLEMMQWQEMAERIERTMYEEKGLLPNLDFYTAVVYLLLHIPVETYTPIFVASRITGWCAHFIEQQDNNRLIRPRATYSGPAPREFLPIQYRQ